MTNGLFDEPAKVVPDDPFGPDRTKSRAKRPPTHDQRATTAALKAIYGSEERHAEGVRELEVIKAEIESQEPKQSCEGGATRFTTPYLLKWGHRQRWMTTNSERYSFRPRKGKTHGSFHDAPLDGFSRAAEHLLTVLWVEFERSPRGVWPDPARVACWVRAGVPKMTTDEALAFCAGSAGSSWLRNEALTPSSEVQ